MTSTCTQQEHLTVALCIRPLFIATHQHYLSGARNHHLTAQDNGLISFVTDDVVDRWIQYQIQFLKVVFPAVTRYAYVVFLLIHFMGSAAGTYLSFYRINFPNPTNVTDIEQQLCDTFVNKFSSGYFQWLTLLNYVYNSMFVGHYFQQLISRCKYMLHIRRLHKIHTFTNNLGLDSMFFTDCLSSLLVFYTIIEMAITVTNWSSKRTNTINLEVYDFFAFHKLVIILYVLATWFRLQNRLMYMLCDCFRFLFFISAAMMALCMFSGFWHLFVLPCEIIIYDGEHFDIQTYLNALYYIFRLLMNYSDFDTSSYQRIQMTHIIFVLFVAFFLSNFLIALLSDAVNAIGGKDTYHFKFAKVRLVQEHIYNAHYGQCNITSKFNETRSKRRCCRASSSKKSCSRREILNFAVSELKF